MTNLPSTKILDICDEFINMTPKQQKIAFKFYLWTKAIRKKTMKDIHMAIDTIAQKSGCKFDTVSRFTKKYPHLVVVCRRTSKTNLYYAQDAFMRAMQFMDDFGIFKFVKRAQKSWLLNLFKQELEIVHNCQICDPSCSDLRPKPNSYPSFKVVHDRVPKNPVKEMLQGLPLALWQQQKLSNYSDQIIVEALNDYRWYGRQKQIYNPYGLLINRARAHHAKTSR